jgi:hypothetical protein
MNANDDDLAAQLRAATELLESVAQDRSVLANLNTDERSRLLNAAGDVFCPDVEERRQQIRARRRRQRSEKAQRDQAVLDSTGIRTLRAQEVFTSPNVFPPVGFVQTDVSGATQDQDPEPFRETSELFVSESVCIYPRASTRRLTAQGHCRNRAQALGA